LKRKKKTYLDQYGLTCQTNNLGYEIRIIPWKANQKIIKIKFQSTQC
jgi:hypothetical protein